MYRIQATGEIKSQGEIRRLHSNTSLPRVWSSEVCQSLGIDPVLEAPTPTPSDDLKIVIQVGAVQDSLGNWVQAYEERDRHTEYTDYEGVIHTKAEQDSAYLATKAQEASQRLIGAITTAVQNRLDTFAKTRNYDGILSACTYATSTNTQFAAEGQYCVTARDNTWGTLYQILSDVTAGNRPTPTGYDDIESELPTLAWPV